VGLLSCKFTTRLWIAQENLLRNVANAACGHVAISGHKRSRRRPPLNQGQTTVLKKPGSDHGFVQKGPDSPTASASKNMRSNVDSIKQKEDAESVLF
jgi:hypothetical protein